MHNRCRHSISLLLLPILLSLLIGCQVREKGPQGETEETLWYPFLESTVEKTEEEQRIYDSNIACMTDASIPAKEAAQIADFFFEYSRSSRIDSDTIKFAEQLSYVEGYGTLPQPYIHIEAEDDTSYWFSFRDYLNPHMDAVWKDEIGGSLLFGIVE